MPRITTPRAEAHQWAGARAAAGKLVGPAADLPSARAVAALRRERLLVDALDGAAWVLRAPDSTFDDDQLRLAVYWPLVRVLTDVYHPAALDRASAIRLLVGEATPPAILHIRHRSSASERSLSLTPRHRMVLTPLPPAIPADAAGLPGTDPAPAPVTVAGTPLPIVSPAWALLSLPLGELRAELSLVAAWLQHLRLATGDLRRAYSAAPRPVVATRLAALARDAGNDRLAEQVRAVVEEHGDSLAQPSKTGRFVLPATYREGSPAPTPYVARFIAQLHEYAGQMRRARIAGRRLAPHSRPEVIAAAQAAKRDDIYHSTTIEGYHVGPADVEAVLSGRPIAGRTPDEVERLMALKGYARAFEETLRRLPEPPAQVALTENLILDLHTELWTPSIEAGIVQSHDLRSWRTRQAFLQGRRYVPPGPEKMPGLIRALGEQIALLDLTTVQRAALVHWAFETIHPFQDGNGRVGRLLMNLILGAGGVAWVTIRAEERGEYFRALETAQVDGDIRPWARFLASRAARRR